MILDLISKRIYFPFNKYTVFMNINFLRKVKSETTQYNILTLLWNTLYTKLIRHLNAFTYIEGCIIKTMYILYKKNNIFAHLFYFLYIIVINLLL